MSLLEASAWKLLLLRNSLLGPRRLRGRLVPHVRWCSDWPTQPRQGLQNMSVNTWPDPSATWMPALDEDLSHLFRAREATGDGISPFTCPLLNDPRTASRHSSCLTTRRWKVAPRPMWLPTGCAFCAASPSPISSRRYGAACATSSTNSFGPRACICSRARVWGCQGDRLGVLGQTRLRWGDAPTALEIPTGRNCARWLRIQWASGPTASARIGLVSVRIGVGLRSCACLQRARAPTIRR